MNNSVDFHTCFCLQLKLLRLETVSWPLISHTMADLFQLRSNRKEAAATISHSLQWEAERTSSKYISMDRRYRVSKGVWTRLRGCLYWRNEDVLFKVFMHSAPIGISWDWYYIIRNHSGLNLGLLFCSFLRRRLVSWKENFKSLGLFDRTKIEAPENINLVQIDTKINLCHDYN